VQVSALPAGDVEEGHGCSRGCSRAAFRAGKDKAPCRHGRAPALFTVIVPRPKCITPVLFHRWYSDRSLHQCIIQFYREVPILAISSRSRRSALLDRPAGGSGFTRGKRFRLQPDSAGSSRHEERDREGMTEGLNADRQIADTHRFRRGASDVTCESRRCVIIARVPSIR
jgi:hypothetical protein